MSDTAKNTFNTEKTLDVNGKKYTYYDLTELAGGELGDVSKLPFSLKVLLENLLRWEDGRTVTRDMILAFKNWLSDKTSKTEIAYRPARVLMQDFTGVPAVVDLAAMRDAMTALKGDPEKINPLTPVDLVIDHSVMVDAFATDDAFDMNVAKEFERNQERYEFLRWGSEAFENFRVVPPGTGICHQVNLEYLAKVVWTKEENGKTVAYPDTLVGTDSHTTMVNGLGVLGWGVGGIEAEAAMLGQPVSMVIPEVVGFKLDGKLPEGTTATDLVLTVTEMLRKQGVVGKFVEFYGPGISSMTIADRATLGNMSPEFGSTCAIFPVDEETLRYMRFTGRDEDTAALTEAYAKAQGMWFDPNHEPEFTVKMGLDLSTVVPSMAGPKRPQDRVSLSSAADEFANKTVPSFGAGKGTPDVAGTDYQLKDGAVVIAAITSCTNTSNPSVMIGAGLVARKAREKGLTRKPWVKTSLAPGSQVVTDYLEKANLQDDLDAVGFNLVGYGCTTCIGNSGPLPENIAAAVEEGDLVVCSVLSGNRNFEGRISPHTKANYLASPPLVVAYALAGSMNIDLLNDPLGQDQDGNDVFLKDVWPTSAEIQEAMEASLTPEMFKSRYGNVFEGPKEWQAIQLSKSLTYQWSDSSSYVKHPPYFEGMGFDFDDLSDITGARPLAILGDSVTTDHISPAGAIALNSPAGKYLQELGVNPTDFNSYGSRRGNHEVMMRGTFANIRLQNEMTPETQGSSTKHMPSGERTSIYDGAMKYIEEGTPLVILAGKEYGTGSSRDWAAKGTRLLGVKAVVAESFERIHRSNLIGMGVLPLQFKTGNRQTLKLDGSETYDIKGISAGLSPRQDLEMTITRSNGDQEPVTLLCRLDTEDEVDYFRNGGILHMVVRNLASPAAVAAE